MGETHPSEQTFPPLPSNAHGHMLETLSGGGTRPQATCESQKGALRRHHSTLLAHAVIGSV